MMNIYHKGFLGVYLIIGLIWIRSSSEKILGEEFVDSLGGILTKVAKGNPNPWYKNFLESTVIPNSKLFANLTIWGEFLTAFSITLGVIFLLFSKTKEKIGKILLIGGLIGGIFLNAVFWLGFAYTSTSVDSLNLLMFFIELIGMTVFIKTFPKKQT